MLRFSIALDCRPPNQLLLIVPVLQLTTGQLKWSVSINLVFRICLDITRSRLLSFFHANAAAAESMRRHSLLVA
ncbi:hypothetical protein L596_009214 [Steinernema carpocapsae]|uniref:Uncharacterized protein n=1 Tax=Steinernema carpocapsae TaxID=34508 RepID=A0A4U5PEP7_STECR|nr:hypothetical protein L596_009214 [Steinernema carpocapsae]